MKRIAKPIATLALALALAAPAAAQQPGFDLLPDRTTVDEQNQQIYTYDATETPRDGRMRMSVLLATRLGVDLSNVGLLSAPQQATFRAAIGVPTFAAGTNVTFRVVGGQTFIDTSGGVTTFTGLTDTPVALTANMCLAVNAAATALVLQTCTAGGLDAAGVDARIAPWARMFNPAGLIPDSFIPDTIARDLEIPILIEGTGIHIDVSGRSYTINATAAGGTSDGVVTGGTFDFNAGTLHLNRSNSLSTVNVGGFPTVGTIDGRIAPFARGTNPSGTIPDIRVPMSITRDSEIVANPGGTGLTDLTTITLPDGETYALAASGGGAETDMVLQWSGSTSSPANLAAVNTTTPTGLMPAVNADIIALRARINGSHPSAHNDWSEWHLLDAATYRALMVIDGISTAPADSQSYSVDSGGPPVDQHIFPVRVSGTVQLGWRGTVVAGPSVVEMRTARWVTVGGSGGAGGSDHYRGIWDNATTYAVADIVFYADDYWIARLASTGDTPSIGPNDSWLLLTEHGRFRGFVANSDAARFYQAGDSAVIDGNHLYEYLGQTIQSFNAAGIRLSSNWVQLTNDVATVTQVEAEAGTETDVRLWSPQRVAQAIAALAPSGGGGGSDDGVVTGVDLVLSGSSLSTLLTRSAGLSTLQDSVNLPNPADSVATWARAVNPTGTAPGARLGGSLGTSEFLFTPGSGLTTWRSLNGAPLGGVTGDAVLVASGGTLSTLTTNTVGDVLTRTAAGYGFSTPSGGGGGTADGGWSEDDYWGISSAFTSALPTWTFPTGSPLTYETNNHMQYPWVPPDGVIGLVVTLWRDNTRVATVMRDWGSGFNTSNLFSTDGSGARLSFDPQETSNLDNRYTLLVAISGGPFTNEVTARVHPWRGGVGPQGPQGVAGAADGVANSLGWTFDSPSSISTLTIGRSIGQDLTANLFFPAATILNRGLVELATTTEADTGTNAQLAVTPAGVSAAISDRLVRSDLIAGNNITLQPGTGNTVTIASTGAGAADGTADSVSFVFSGRTFTGTVGRTVGNDLTDTATLPIASASSFGVLEIATAAEVNTGTDDTRAVTPLRMADRLRRSDLVAGNNITLVPGTGNTVTIESTGGGGGGSNDGVANTLDYAFSGRTFTGTIGRSVGTALTDTVDIPAASTTAQGLIEIATPAEASAGTDNTRAVSPAGLNQAQGNKLERSDILAGTNVTITQGTGNTLTIASSDGGGGGTPTGNARGDLIATSSTLPTGALDEGTAFSNTWTAASGQSVTVAGNTLEFEYNRPEASIGVIVVARTGTTTLGEVFVPWSGAGGYFSTGITHGLQPLRLSSTAVMGVSSGMNFQGGRPVSWDGAWEVQLVSGGDGVPANTVVTVYDAVVRGEAGPQGPAGTGTAFDFYADVPTEILTPTSGTRFLVAPVNEAGEPNRWMGLSVLKEEVGPDIFAGNTLISGDASQIQFAGDGVSLADIIGTEAVTITIPGTVSTDATITGDGSPGSPLSAVGGGGGGVTYQLLSEIEVGDPNDITAGLISGNRLDYFLERSRNGLSDLSATEGVADNDQILIYNQSNNYVAARESVSDFVGRTAGEGLVAVNDGGRTRLVANYADTGVETATPTGLDYVGFTDVDQADADDQVKRMTFDSLRSLVRSAGLARASFTWSDSFTTLPHGQAAIENFQGTQRLFVGINPATAPVLDQILRALVSGDHVTIVQGNDIFVIRLTSGVTVHTDAATDVLRWNFAIVTGAEAFTAGQAATVSFTDNVALIPAAWAEESSAAIIPIAKLPPPADNSITKAKMADDAVGPDEMDPESATAGQVMMIGSGGAPAWSFPFEFPRTRFARDHSASGDALILTSTIQAAVGDTINVSATVTVTQAGTGSCRIRFYTTQSSVSVGLTIVTNTSETETMTITSSVTVPANNAGSAVPISMQLDGVSIFTGESCAIDSGDATLTLTTS